MALKSVALSVVNSCATTLPPFASTAFELFSHALAVSGAIVHHADGFAFGVSTA